MQRRFSPRINNLDDNKRINCGNELKEVVDAPAEQGRRASPRLRNIPESKKPYYGSGSKKPRHSEDMFIKKKAKFDHSIEICQHNRAREFVEDKSYGSDTSMGSVPSENVERKLVNSEPDDLKWTGSGNGILDNLGKSTFLKVKETLRLLNLHFLRNFQEEEKRYRKVKVSDLQVVSASKTKMKNNKIFNLDKNISQLPGIEVGNQFFSHAEMVAVGFHGQWLSGSDHESSKLVADYWAAKDASRYSGFKYCLKQLKKQQKMDSKGQVCFIREQVSKVPHGSTRLVCMDISCGQEDICIPATNAIDNPPVAPSGFTYIKSIQVSKNVIVPPNAPGCNCKGSCTDPKSCYCAQLNGLDFPYVHEDGGRLIEAKDVVFECGPGCGCEPGCVNRTTQQGLKYQLEVYRTKEKGWAVRSWDYIPSGAPVCEYTGVLRRSDELDNVTENDFIFEIDCWQTMNEVGVRERRLCNVSVPTSTLVKKTNDQVSESSPEFCIDAGLYGNVARFINHSCEPNLFVQCVLSSHHDIRLARVVLFAADDIPPMQELTYDYGYELDSVVGPDGKIKKLPCNCGTADCRKRLY